jgi:predicted Zn-dependent peptidase
MTATEPGPAQLTLPSGLRVTLAYRSGIEIVSTCLHVNAGFRNEPSSGLAHLVEHLHTEGVLDGQPESTAIASMGGVLNATTSLDYAQYLTTVPRAGLPVALRYHAQRLTTLPDPDLLAVQRRVVQAEVRRNIDQRPHGRLVLSELPAVLYDDFANAHDGYADTAALDQLTPDDVAAFILDRYHPTNAHLSVVGDFDPDTVADLLNTTLPDPPNQQNVTGYAELAGQLGEDRTRVTTSPAARRSRTAWGFRLPGTTTTTTYLSHVVLSELVNASDCPCHGADRPWGPVASRVSRTGNPFDMVADSMFVLETGHENLADRPYATHCLLAILDGVAAGTVTADDLMEVTYRTAIQLLAEQDSLPSVASLLCLEAHLDRGPDYFAALPTSLSAVSPAAVAAAAEGLLSNNRAEVTSLPNREIHA